LHVALFEDVEEADLNEFVEFGTSFMAKMRGAFGDEPKCRASRRPCWVPAASLSGSISPMTSANLVPGASRSP